MNLPHPGMKLGSPALQVDSLPIELSGKPHASKVMLKILQVKLQQYVNQELSDVQAGFREDRGTRDQIANIHWIIEKAREYHENIYLCFIDYTKVFVWIITNYGKFLKRWEFQSSLRVS